MAGDRCVQCSATSKSGARCKLNTCMQFPYCWVHLKSIDKLQVKDSTVPNSGKGLFYVGKKDFPAKKRITLYSSQKLGREKVEGDYVLEVSSKQFIDAKDKLNYVGRYINSIHSTGKRPNVRFGTGSVVTKKTVAGGARYTYPIISSKRIKPNTELFLSYGKSYRF